MLEICQKNIDCCGCPNMDTCNALKQEKLLHDLFDLYGNYHKDMTSKQFYITCEHPEKIETESDIMKWLDHANKDIEKLELYIARLQAYKMELVKRYNYIMTRPTKEKILLQRYKKYRGNVYYYIIFYTVDLETGTEKETDRKTYKGTEKKQALKDFETICKDHKNAIIIKDIDKKSWEK